MFHTVEQGDTFFKIAKKYNLTVAELLEMNGLKSWDILKVGQRLRIAKQPPVTTEKTPAVSEKNLSDDHFYTVKEGDSLAYIASLYQTSPLQICAWNNLAPDATIFVGQRLRVKAGDPNVKTTTNPATSETEEIYTVQRGDTLFAIARRFATTPEEILRLNDLAANATLFAGQSLKVRKIPAPANTNRDETPATIQTGALLYTVQRGDSLFNIARMFKTTPEKILADNNLAPNATIFVGQTLKIQTDSVQQKNLPQVKLYTVKQGDSILSISQQFGISPQRLLELNGFHKDTLIYVGQELKVAEGDVVGVAQPDMTTVRPANTYKVERGDSLASIARRFQTTPAAILAENNLQLDATLYVGQLLRIPPQPTPASPLSVKESGNYQTYTVKSGDWLSKIANDFHVSAEAIIKLNNLPNNALTVGQVLLIPPPEPPRAPLHLSHRLKDIQKARELFELEEINGKAIFGNGLKGSVGGSGKTHPDDLEKVQTRLVQLGLLPVSHNETPLMLRQRLRGGDIWPDSIPQTIAAIGRFQQQYKLTFWTQTPARIAMMGTDKFIPNVVNPNDLTYKVLRELTRYRLTFPHPITHQKMTAEFTNFVVSNFNEYYDGVGYRGQSLFDFPPEEFRKMGLDESLAQAMRYVSKHEGNFDAINTFDKALFSYGFIQFAGTPAGGALARLLGRIKHEHPRLFDEHFRRFGIDVNYQFKNGKISAGEISLLDPYARTGKHELTGIEAEKVLRADKQLYGCFLRAGFEPALMLAQIAMAIDEYVRPALNIRLDIYANGLILQNVPIIEIINSTMGITTLIDLTVNQWIHRTRDYFRAAIEAIMEEEGIHTLKGLRSIDERAVLEKMMVTATDTRVAMRIQSILESTFLSSEKRQGYIPSLP